MTEPPHIAVVLLVDRGGRILLHLRDSVAPKYPDLWSLPGGHTEPGESPGEAAARELWEETALISDVPLERFAAYRYEDDGRVLDYFAGSTSARDEDVVLGEGAALAFTTPAGVFDGRPFVPGVRDVIERFLASPAYTRLAGGTPLPHPGNSDGNSDGDGDGDEAF